MPGGTGQYQQPLGGDPPLAGVDLAGHHFSGSVEVPLPLDGDDARVDVLGSWPNRISELERGLLCDTDLALRYQAMLGGGEPGTSDAKNAA